ncbi:hypothetical protein HanRHA438_Chr12g0563151 [Helianthus annuus]|nr:hypothetical protein HanRHA438_Chr12g0563151 [Helianthus annuus]
MYVDIVISDDHRMRLLGFFFLVTFLNLLVHIQRPLNLFINVLTVLDLSLMVNNLIFPE